MECMRIGKFILQVVGIGISLNNNALLWSQQSNTQFQDFAILTGVKTNTTYAILPQNNIGQSNHSLTLQFGNAPTFTCNSGGANFISLEGSNDNSSWVTIFIMTPELLSNVNAPFTVRKSGVGAFPFLRVHVLQLINLCTVTMHYTGTLFPEATPNGPSQIVFSNFNTAMANGSAAPFSIIPGAQPGAIGTIPGIKIVIYGANFTDTTTVAAVPITFTVGSVTQSFNCNTAPVGTVTFDRVLFQITIPGGSAMYNSFVLPNSAVPYFSSDANPAITMTNQICIDASAAPANHTFRTNITYRFE